MSGYFWSLLSYLGSVSPGFFLKAFFETIVPQDHFLKVSSVKLLIQHSILVAGHFPPKAVYSLILHASFQSSGAGFHRQVSGTTDAMTLGKMEGIATQVDPPLELLIADSQSASRDGFFHSRW